MKNNFNNNPEKYNYKSVVQYLKVQSSKILSSISKFTTVDVFNFLTVIAFCLLFGCSLAISSELKNGVNQGKHFYLTFSAILFTILSAVHLLKRLNEISFKASWVDLLMVCYLLYTFLNIWFTQKEFLTDTRFVELAFLTIVYFAGKAAIKRSNDVQLTIIILSFLSFGLYQAYFGLQQLYGFEFSHHSSFKVTGSFFNPAPYSGYLISIFPVGLSIYHYTPETSIGNKLLKYFGLGTALAILLIIPSTLSRASWIALVAGALMVYYKHFDFPKVFNRYLKNRINKILAIGLTSIVIASSAIGLFYWKKDSAMGRALIWEITLDMIKESPIVGVGFDQYSAAFGEQQAAYFQSDEYSEEKAMVAGKGEYAFNELLLITAETGILGLILFLGIVFFALSVYFQPFTERNNQQRALIVGSAGGLIGLLVFSLFSYPFSIAPLLLNFFFYLSILVAHSHRGFDLNIIRPVRLIVFVGLLAFCYWGYKTQINKYDALFEWKTASQLKSYGDYEDAIEMMKKIEPILSHDGNFMFEYGQALTLNKNYENGIEVLEKAAKLTSDPYLFNSLGDCYQATKNYEKAEEAYIHAFYLIPHKFYPRYLLAKLYDEMGEKEKANETAQLLLNMKIKVPSTAIEEMREDMKGLIESGLEKMN